MLVSVMTEVVVVAKKMMMMMDKTTGLRLLVVLSQQVGLVNDNGHTTTNTAAFK